MNLSLLLALSKDSRTPLRRSIHAHVDAAKAAFSAGVRSVYQASPSGDPEQIGSCLLLDICGEKILLTAAHVCDHNKTASLYIVGAEELVLLDADFIITEAPKGDRLRDRGDFAAARISPEMIAKLGDGYIREDQIGSPAPIGAKHLFTALGYPNDTNAVVDEENLRVGVALQSHSATRKETPKMRRKAGHGGAAHIFISYGSRSRIDGRKTASLPANGFSGGAVIDDGRPGDLQAVLGNVTPDPKLVGLIIERWGEQGVLVAVRLDAILPIVKAKLGL